MNRLPSIAIRVALATIFLFFALNVMKAQEPAPAAPKQEPSKADAAKPEATKPEAAKQGATKKEEKGDEEENDNPFAPQPAQPLPPGMTGSDVNDLRFKLTPGLYDAGETSAGMKHLQLVKKPSAFQLGSA